MELANFIEYAQHSFGIFLIIKSAYKAYRKGGVGYAKLVSYSFSCARIVGVAFCINRIRQNSEIAFSRILSPKRYLPASLLQAKSLLRSGEVLPLAHCYTFFYKARIVYIRKVCVGNSCFYAVFLPSLQYSADHSSIFEWRIL